MTRLFLPTTLLVLAATFLGFVEADKYCASYCDQQDVKADGFYCKDTEFCCGSLRTRYCCNNSTLDISDKYPKNVSICSNTAWLIYHWQLLLGSMGIMIMLIVIAACCCQCCTLKTGGWQRATGSRGRRADRSETELSNIDVDQPDLPNMFDPSHPYAFSPPDYESLTKDPPPYSVIFGTDNQAFEDQGGPSETIGQAGLVEGTEPPPPSYEEHTSLVGLSALSPQSQASSQHQQQPHPHQQQPQQHQQRQDQQQPHQQHQESSHTQQPSSGPPQQQQQQQQQHQQHQHQQQQQHQHPHSPHGATPQCVEEPHQPQAENNIIQAEANTCSGQETSGRCQGSDPSEANGSLSLTSVSGAEATVEHGNNDTVQSPCAYGVSDAVPHGNHPQPKVEDTGTQLPPTPCRTNDDGESPTVVQIQTAKDTVLNI